MTNQSQLKPLTQKAVKGMKWAAYTMDAPVQFFRTLDEARNAVGSCATVEWNRRQCGYDEVDDHGRCYTFDRLSSVNNNHIEHLFIDRIESGLRAIMDNIELMQDRD